MPPPCPGSVVSLPTCDRGRWSLSVPWDRADRLQSKLRSLGFPTTLCLDPADRVARLELWPGVDPLVAHASLAAVAAAGPSVTTGRPPPAPPVRLVLAA